MDGHRSTDIADDLAELFREHRHRLVWTAARLTGSWADAEDVVQDAFIVALERMATVNPDCPGAWLTGVTRYRAMAMGRAGARTVPAGDAIERAPDERRSIEATNGGRCMAEADTTATVDELLSRLPLHQRQVLHLWCVDGLPWGVVATRMDMPRRRAQRIGYDALRRMRTAATVARGAEAHSVSGRVGDVVV